MPITLLDAIRVQASVTNIGGFASIYVRGLVGFNGGFSLTGTGSIDRQVIFPGVSMRAGITGTLSFSRGQTGDVSIYGTLDAGLNGNR